MKYKARMVFLTVLCIPLAVVTSLVFIPLAIFGFAASGVAYAWRWVVRESIDEELTAAWNDLVETIGIDKLAIEF